jgi:hypothetical protein
MERRRHDLKKNRALFEEGMDSGQIQTTCPGGKASEATTALLGAENI